MRTLALMAQAGGGAGGFEALLFQLAPFVLIIFIFYFLLIRPQRQRQKAHEAMVNALQPGDKIVTQGGVDGTVTKTDLPDARIRVRIAPSVEITMLRSSVAAKAGEESSS